MKYIVKGQNLGFVKERQSQCKIQLFKSFNELIKWVCQNTEGFDKQRKFDIKKGQHKHKRHACIELQ